MAACCTTVFPLLTLALSVRASQTTDRRQCAVLIEDPLSVFGQSSNRTQPLAEYLASDLTDCMDYCCHGEKYCNVGMFIDSTSSDTNCWLYSCYPLDSCAFKIRKTAQVFVDPHATYRYNYDYLTTAYQDYNVDDGSDYQYTDYITKQDYNEEYNTEEDNSDLFSISQSTTTSTSSIFTTTQIPAGVAESGFEPTSAENDASVLPMNDSILQGDTFTTPDHGDIVKNDTFSTENYTIFGENDAITTHASEDTEENNPIVSSFTPENDTVHENGNFTELVKDEYDVENDTAHENGNFTELVKDEYDVENDTAHENGNFTELVKDEYDVENDAAIPADQLVNIVSSFNLLQSEVKSSQTPDMEDQAYIIQPTLTVSSEALAGATDTSYSRFLTAAPVFSSSNWSIIGNSTLAEVESTTRLSGLDGPETPVSSGSVMADNAGDDVGTSRRKTGEVVTGWTASTQTCTEPEQTTTKTLDIFPASDTPYQDYSHNDTMLRADIDYQPSEAVVGLLVSALAVGCMCALAVVGVLSLRLYDGYKKRHYSRLDYLINGIYN
ncbi:hypothetical protein BsWGS_28307 [Bradybaena similaris]